MKKKLYISCLILFISILAKGTSVEVGLFGYENQVRLCKGANEIFHIYCKSANPLNGTFNIEIILPEGVAFEEFITDNSWILPRWSIKTPPTIKSLRTSSGNLVKFLKIKVNKKSLFGLGFIVHTTRGTGKGIISLKVTNKKGKIISQVKYNVIFLPPIRGKRPDKLRTFIATYPVLKQEILKKTIGNNIINAGFTDFLVMNGTYWKDQTDAILAHKAGLRIVANLFSSVIFQDFPYEKYPKFRELSKFGKPLKNVDMQMIIEQHPAVIEHMKKFFDKQFLEYGYEGFQYDEERSPWSGFTREGIKAFREWAGINENIELNAKIIQELYPDLWIQFRNLQVSKVMKVIAKLIHKHYPGIEIGYYGCPQVISKHQKWTKKSYVYDWRLLAGTIDYGGAGYDFPMIDYQHTVKCLRGQTRFYPWYMVCENVYDWHRKYRKISADIVKLMIATDMQGFAIWYSLNCDNGAFYDIAEANTFLAKYENFFLKGKKTPEIVQITPQVGEFETTTYTIKNKHLTILVNSSSQDKKFHIFSPNLIDKSIIVPAKSFKTVEFTGKIANLLEYGKEDFENKSVGEIFCSEDNLQAIVVNKENNKVLQVICSKSGKYILPITGALPVSNCIIEVDAIIGAVKTNSFARIGLVVRDGIFCGYDCDFKKNILWAHYHTADGKSMTYYVRHGGFNKVLHIKIKLKDSNVILWAGKKLSFETAIRNPSIPSLFIQTKTPITVYFDNITIHKLKSEGKGTPRENSIPQV